MIIHKPHAWRECRAPQILPTRKLPVDRKVAPTAQEARHEAQGGSAAFWSAKALVAPERTGRPRACWPPDHSSPTRPPAVCSPGW